MEPCEDFPVEDEFDVECVETEPSLCDCGYFCYNCLDLYEDDFF
jgi:hypothetical protein